MISTRTANSEQRRANKQVLMLLTNAFDPDPRVYQEARSLVQHGYEVRIVCWDREYKKAPLEHYEGIFVERIYVRSTHGRGMTQMFFLPIFWIKAFLHVMSDDFSIVHCHDFDTLPLGFVLAKFKKKKLVYDAHESFPDMLADSLPQWFIRLLRASESWFVKRVDALITVGNILEKHFQEKGARKTCVVGNWKRLDDFIFDDSHKKNLREKLRIGYYTPVVSFIGWFNKERKIDELLNAAALCPNIHFLLGGDGPDKAKVEEKAASLPNVTYLGYVHSSHIPQYTAISDIVVYSFDKNNPNARFSSPNKLFEALAAGKAVVSGDFGEIAKIVKEENCGVVLESFTARTLAEALQNLSGNGKLNMYQKSARRAGQLRYNWDMAEKTLLEAYSSLMDGRQ